MDSYSIPFGLIISVRSDYVKTHYHPLEMEIAVTDDTFFYVLCLLPTWAIGNLLQYETNNRFRQYVLGKIPLTWHSTAAKI